MKKIMIFAAVAALLSLSSCTKEGPKNTDNGSPVFTAGINPGTKTTVDTQYGKVAWEETDVITITDGAKNSAKYGITKIDANGCATFEYSSGAELGVGPYSAVYGTQPEKNQTYSATAPGKLYMTASSENNVLTFTVQCALMEINLTKEGESVKKIEVTGKPDGKEETTYTLTCTEAVSIAEQKSFYIALPAGTYTKIVITDSEDKVCTLNVKDQGIPVTVNQIIPATFDAEHLNFPQPTTGTATRTGNIAVNWVQLWENGPKFAEYNVGAANNKAEDYGGYYTPEGDNTVINLWGSNWRMPKREELKGLMDNCDVTWTQVNNVNGRKFTGKTEPYTSNSVFLPAAGRNNFGTFDEGSVGYYWSSTKLSSNTFRLKFSLGSQSVDYSGFIQGDTYSVRAVLAE